MKRDSTQIQIFQNFLSSNIFYPPSEIKNVTELAFNHAKTRSKNKIEYINIPCSFDIETSSFYYNDEKCCCMYEWTLGLNGACIIGRTWGDFLLCMKKLSEKLELSESKILVIYVHNLSYEFQFIRKFFKWTKVFAVDNRKPVYATTDMGIEFRCSYLLSGYSLEKVGEHLTKYIVEKKVGDLDYEKIRHSKTPLYKKELGYCINDAKVVMAYIMERIEIDGGITKIPLTKTGYVREYCRKNCMYSTGKNGKKYHDIDFYNLIGSLTLEPDEYKQLKRAFQGGFTHANAFYSDMVIEEVGSDDFTSSYPCVMVAEMFPMSKGEIVEVRNDEDFYHNMKCYCCLFDIEFTNLRPKVSYENYISESRCWNVEKAQVNNGRIVRAKKLRTTITEQDFAIINKLYKWDSKAIGTFRRYKKSYLPTQLVKSILKLYQDKTVLKGIAGKEVEYLASKEQLNSCYGMMVTDIVRDEYVYKGEKWGLNDKDFDKAIEKYNHGRNRFLFYPWGVWVTAYARRNLFTGICEFKNDYIYSDTDSIKTINRWNHIDYINKYNTMMTDRLKRALDYHGLSYDLIAPKTSTGKVKQLGVWDFEGTYNRFKTLGAKRYMIETKKQLKVVKSKNIKCFKGIIVIRTFNPSVYENHISITVSGLNKKITVSYLTRKYGNKVFENFTNKLYVPSDYTGKNTHTYIDNEMRGIITDYLGNVSEFHELSGIHLEKADYNLSLSGDYLKYITSLERM